MIRSSITFVGYSVGLLKYHFNYSVYLNGKEVFIPKV